MIVVYQKISEKEMRAMAADTVPKLEFWFKNNPKRRVCHVKTWYEKMAKIRRGHVKEDVDKAVEAALSK